MEVMSTFADFLKTWYIAEIRMLMNKSSYFYFRMERDTAAIAGKNATVALQRGLIPTGARDEDDSNGLPSPGTVPKETAIIPLAFNYARIQFSGIVEAATKSEIGAFASVVDNQTQAAQNSLALIQQIQCIKPHEGRLTTVTAAFNGDATGAVAAVTMTVGTTQWLYPGMRIGTLDDSNTYAAMDTGLIIDSILSDTTISVTGTISTAIDASAVSTGVGVYVYQNRNKQMYGLDNIFDTSGTDTYLSVDRSAVAEWIACNIGNSGVSRPLTLNLMQQAVDDPSKKALGKITAIHCREEMRRAYVHHLVADRRYNYPDTLKLDGGFSGLAYTGGDKPIPVVVDRHMTPGTMYFLDETTFKLYRMGGGVRWIPGPVNGIFHPMLTASTSADAMMAGLKIYQNLACLNPRKNSMLYDLDEM